MYRRENVYKCEVRHVSDKKVAEFNYKLLNNTLNDNFRVSKRDEVRSSQCDVYHMAEGIEHLLYKFKLSKSIQEKKFSKIWKTTVIVFFNETDLNNKPFFSK